MSARVLLVACEEMPEGDGDEHALPEALGALDIHAEWVAWGEGEVTADLVVLRASWDYDARRAEFLEWCASVPRLANAVEVVRWNTDKAYLAELAADGVATVPTELVRPGETPDWPSGDVVVKPTIGAGSRGVGRFDAGQRDAAAEHLAALHASGHAALVQPFQSDVDIAGETALVYFGGVYSHAFHKVVGLSTMSESDLYADETLKATEPSAACRRLGEDTLDAASARLGIRRADLLYARVDVLRGSDGGPVLLELELTEPSVGFAVADAGAPLRFASAIRAALWLS
ncbi:MAG: hypothetical protein GEU98_03610 [Pseudonocardiaceae bacterium]|nr:hypothetical protein [Pseudonocardiaceae bacterium]